MLVLNKAIFILNEKEKKNPPITIECKGPWEGQLIADLGY